MDQTQAKGCAGMTRADDYRARATDYEKRAGATDNPISRRELQGRARAWRQLAQDADALERIAADRASRRLDTRGRVSG